MFTEDLNTELKEIYVSDIKKEVVAFANTDGGTVFVGVTDNGIVKGIDNPDDVMQQAANSLKDSIKPDVMPFVQIRPMDVEGKTIVSIEVASGTNKPYYLSEKGLKPSGVYVRRSTSSQPLSDEGIREMIINTSGKTYEKSRSMNQSLTFVSFTKAMNERSIEVGEAQFKTMRLIGDDGLYTNLALLLSEQCEHSTKLAVFQGTDKAVFRDRREFTGSLLKQLEEAFYQINKHNNTKATINGLIRTDVMDYDTDAIREALLNSIVHRDYSFSGSTLINIYDDRIEFVSLGGLVSGLTIEAVFMGVSQSRNPELAAVFYRMKLIESYGTGIGKIRRAYANNAVQPVFETAPGAFKVTLPNVNIQSVPLAENKNVLAVLEYVNKNGSITRAETEKITELKTTAAHKLLKALCNERRIEPVGTGKNIRYYPIK